MSGLATLKFLNLTDAGVTDAGVPHLAQLKSLETLWLPEGDLTDEGIKELQAALEHDRIMRRISLRSEGIQEFDDKGSGLDLGLQRPGTGAFLLLTDAAKSSQVYRLTITRSRGNAALHLPRSRGD